MSSPQHAIDYVEFGTPDIPAAKTFLAAAFGWQFTDYGPDYQCFTDGRIAGALRPGPASAPASNPLIILYSADLDASLAQVKKFGGRVTAEPFEFPGGRRFEFVAPGALALAVWSDIRADGSKIA